jgi:hypothetical protein
VKRHEDKQEARQVAKRIKLFASWAFVGDIGGRIMVTPKQKTWQDWHEIRPDLFPLPLELREAQSRSIGCRLREIPLELVKDANRCPNPWLDLASMKLIAHYRSLFLSCASVLSAWDILADFGWGGATGAKQRSRLSERMENARKCGEDAKALRLEKKIVDAMLRYDPELTKKLARNAGDEKLQAFDAVSRESRERSRRPMRMDSRERAKVRLTETYPIQILIVSNWIRCGTLDDPGWCFFTNQALANLLSLLDWTGFDVKGEDISAEQVEQICVRLGLRKPDNGFLCYSDAKLDDKSGVIRLNHFPPKKAREEFPKDASELCAPIRLGQRTLYAGISPATPAKVVGT